MAILDTGIAITRFLAIMAICNEFHLIHTKILHCLLYLMSILDEIKKNNNFTTIIATFYFEIAVKRSKSQIKKNIELEQQ